MFSFVLLYLAIIIIYDEFIINLRYLFELLYEHIYGFMQVAADSLVHIIPLVVSTTHHDATQPQTAGTVQLSRPGRLALLEAPLEQFCVASGLTADSDTEQISTLLYRLGE